MSETLPDEDVALMLQAAKGDQHALESLVRRHQQPLLNFFFRMGVNRDAEDLVQQTFVRLYRYRKRYRPRARFTTFLYLLARQTWIDELRRRERRRALRDRLIDEAEVAVQGSRQVPFEGFSDEVQQALLQLTPAMREVVVLGVLQGLEQAEIARILKIPVGTVKSRMFNGLRQMRQQLTTGAEEK